VTGSVGDRAQWVQSHSLSVHHGTSDCASETVTADELCYFQATPTSFSVYGIVQTRGAYSLSPRLASSSPSHI
jgi:hypothetical protein